MSTAELGNCWTPPSSSNRQRMCPKVSPINRSAVIPLKIYANCLRSDIEYKTLNIGLNSTCKDVIWMLLRKFKMKHRDPNLFYLEMAVVTKSSTQIRSSGLVRIHDSVLMAESKYKCLLVSDITTTTEVISILFRCYGLEDVERVERYQLCEVGPDGSERKLDSEECPVIAQSTWKMTKRFVLKRIVPSSRHSTKPQQAYKNLPSAIDFHPPTAEEDKKPSDNLYSQPCDAMPLNNLYCNPTYISEESVFQVSPSAKPVVPPPLPPPNFSGNRPPSFRKKPSGHFSMSSLQSPNCCQTPSPKTPVQNFTHPPRSPLFQNYANTLLRPDFYLDMPSTAPPVSQKATMSSNLFSHSRSRFWFPDTPEMDRKLDHSTTNLQSKYVSLQELRKDKRSGFYI